MAAYEKTNVPNHVIDRATGAVLNTDMGAYAAIKAQREAVKAQNNLLSEVTALRNEINTLKADVSYLKKKIAKDQ